MKKFLFVLIFGLCSLCSFAQVAVNADDEFYTLARNWELKGYVKSLPQVRPYPLNLIREIIETVIDCGNKQDGTLALEQYERIFKDSNKFIIDGRYYKKNVDDKKGSETNSVEPGCENVSGITFELGFAGDYAFNDMVSVGYDLEQYVETDEYEDLVPYKECKPFDSVFDPATIGGASMYQDWNLNLAYGRPDIYIFGGISKTGFGPFINDGIALNDNAYHYGNIVFNVNRENFTFVQMMASIGACDNLGNTSALSDGKFLAFHSLRYHFNKYIDISYYENIIFGPKFNWVLALPVPYMPAQNIGGASNNLQMGLLFEVKPIPGVKWATDIFIDDFDVNRIVKIDLDCKIRIAGQTGIIFAPSGTTCQNMSLYYTFILPYVYSHWEYNEGTNNVISGSQYNYQNYLNAGHAIGTNLDPNSDRVSFNAVFRPSNTVKLTLNNSFTRHSNSAEAFGYDDACMFLLSKNGTYVTDGSASSHQMLTRDNDTSGAHVNQAWDSLGFMTSDHKLLIASTGAEVEIKTPKTKAGQLYLTLGYNFEWVHNKGVERNLFTGYKGDDDSFYYEYNTSNSKFEIYKKGESDPVGSYQSFKEMRKAAARNDEIKAEINKQKEDWVSQLHDEVNQYFKVAVKWVY